MKKIAFAMGMMFAVSTFASDSSCYSNCLAGATQDGYTCQKIRQLCLKTNSDGYDGIRMCMEDFQSCADHGKSIYEACRDACDKGLDW